jgi:hypothetical protein
MAQSLTDPLSLPVAVAEDAARVRRLTPAMADSPAWSQPWPGAWVAPPTCPTRDPRLAGPLARRPSGPGDRGLTCVDAVAGGGLTVRRGVQ